MTPRFRSDLYRGTAAAYDQYRVPYPQSMLDDLADRVRLSGMGRLLDLACGTGQVTFGLCSRFSEAWAIDLEHETVAFARAKAGRLGVDNVRWIAGPAEGLDTQARFELVTAGNAFHRLDRHLIGASARGWLAPGGHIALFWSDAPWTGPAAWQQALGDAVRNWMAADRVPADLDDALAAESHLEVLAAEGFEAVGTFDFPTPHVWTTDALVGLMYSTSVLSSAALGVHAPAFEVDLRDRLLAVNPDGIFGEQINFAYELARRPDG